MLAAKRIGAVGIKAPVANIFYASVQATRGFSSAAADKTSLADVLPQEIAHEEAEVEIDQEYLDAKKLIQKSFKFKQDDVGKSKVILTRESNGETISISFDVQDASEEETNREMEDEDNEDDETPDFTYGINFETEIQKADGSKLIIDAIASDIITIKNCQYIPAGSSREEHDLYAGPRFEDLEASLQDAFYDYLSERKVDDDMAYFIVSHSREKEQSEYVNWLHKVLDFSAKK